MKFFSSSHLKLLAMVKAKASSILEQQKEEGEESLSRVCLCLLDEEKEMRMASSKGDMAAAS